jgi:hypothetical protein
MDRLLYFSYGSNMSSPRIRHRISSASPISRARLYGHRLKFHKLGRDGSAKCDIEHTRNDADVVHGVVFHILTHDKITLDSYEGLGNGYEQKRISIILPDDTALEAVTYYATTIDASSQPYHWYKEHVLRGAREHKLPEQYVETIASITSIPDPDPDSHIRELSIYTSSIKKTAL